MKKVKVAVACMALNLFGCAALPIPLQPQHEGYSSSAAEGTWLLLDAVDTAQTMHLKPGTACGLEKDPLARVIYHSENPPPGRVLVTNLVLATAHTMVTSWLDDKVAVEDIQREKDDDYGVGPWLAARFVWHAVSLTGTAYSVIDNHYHGCSL
jgi:hypothetical protein